MIEKEHVMRLTVENELDERLFGVLRVDLLHYHMKKHVLRVVVYITILVCMDCSLYLISKLNLISRY